MIQVYPLHTGECITYRLTVTMLSHSVSFIPYLSGGNTADVLRTKMNVLELHPVVCLLGENMTGLK